MYTGIMHSGYMLQWKYYTINNKLWYGAWYTIGKRCSTYIHTTLRTFNAIYYLLSHVFLDIDLSTMERKAFTIFTKLGSNLGKNVSLSKSERVKIFDNFNQ